jgi:hypothetical protein
VVGSRVVGLPWDLCSSSLGGSGEVFSYPNLYPHHSGSFCFCFDTVFDCK